MRLRSYRQSSRLVWWLKVSVITCFCWNALEVLALRWAHSHSEPTPKSTDQKIFISSTHWNNEAILRHHWNTAVVDLVKRIGAQDVYVSVYESGSWDDSKGALRALDQELDALGARRTITLDRTTHADEVARSPAPSGWIQTVRGKKELRRIPYLSSLRNRSLKPLEQLQESGTTFDKILFLNDVVFTVEDVLNLLYTRNGEYAAACAMDYAHPPRYYDTFALRDAEGEETVMQTWPYFRSRASRNAMKTNSPVPVASCWNGMVFMDAAPFYNKTSRLRFRGIPDSLALSHLEASECCLIHADNYLTSGKGVWMNPKVRVGYSQQAYATVHRPNGWLTSSDMLRGIWENRFRRWTTTTWLKRRLMGSRLRRWRRKGHSTEPGIHCLINEMQVLIPNGWAHV